MEGMHRTWCVGGGAEFHAVQAPLSPHLHVFTSLEVVQTLFWGVLQRIHHESTI